MTRFLRLPQVVERVGLSPMTLWRREKAQPPTFPRRVQLSPNAVGWPEEEIEAWCAARVAERDQRAFGETTERGGALADADRP
jgi:prophage regulatory protein